MIKLYNTASKKLENFKPLGDEIKVYTCGPTVYDYAHIGNMTAYIYWDLLVRTLKTNGYSVRRVLNLTDVGHLSSDADEGEDKLEKGALREDKTVWEVADHYVAAFMKDYKALDLIEPEVLARATDYIDEGMEAVDLMREHGFTYETTDGVYFDTSKFKNYADFAKLDLTGLQAGARVGFSEEKRNVSDFAVWKFIQPEENHAMRWNYLGRPGYPGWHLECASIIHKELGEPIDIHTGGIDHIPIHHTNEIAECYAAYGRELARYWLHCDFIAINDEKISKSLGNTYSLDDLAKHDFSPMDFKMWVLSGHYQGTRNFTFESLKGAQARRLNWRNKIALLYQASPMDSTDVSSPAPNKTRPEVFRTTSTASGSFDEILSAVNNNLNSPEAFAIIDTSNLSINDWHKVDELFGLGLIDESPDIDDETRKLITERQHAREARNFTESDRLRDALAARGISIKDTPVGPIWGYIK